jgi:fructose-1,6-bisphosphatase/inositol monophosphatase family enzyme
MTRTQHKTHLDLSAITKAAIRTIHRVQKTVTRYAASDPENAFERVKIGEWRKPLLAIDLFAEMNAKAELYRALGTAGLLVLGEESLLDEGIDLSRETRIVAIVDMIDGTDLFERNLSNWCSAMVFYHPAEKQILAAFVGLPDDGVYYATADRDGAFRCSFFGPSTQAQVSGPSKTTTIQNSSIAFYGQKVGGFLSLAGTRFQDFLKTVRADCYRQKRELHTRIYNLAGNPMAIRLISGPTRIDAVFDLNGQAPHDIVPGAYIAEKAGAYFCGLNGESIDLSRLIERPAHRGSRLRFIIAATPELSLQLQMYLKPKYNRQSHRLRRAA